MNWNCVLEGNGVQAVDSVVKTKPHIGHFNEKAKVTSASEILNGSFGIIGRLVRKHGLPSEKKCAHFSLSQNFFKYD
jgi:hypothetical protein